MSKILLVDRPESEVILNEMPSFLHDAKIVQVTDNVEIEKTNYYIIDISSSLESNIINLLFNNEMIFNKNFTTLWTIKSQLVDSDYSYTKLHEAISINRPIGDIIKCLKHDKLLCCIYGNCQITVISRMLCSSSEFAKKYVIIQLPEIFKVEEYNHDYESFESLLGATDLFIYQHVNKENRFGYKLSTDYILGNLSADCKRICIPNSYVGMYYPQLSKKRGECIPNDELMPYGDSVIQNNIKSKSFNELIHFMTSDAVYSEKSIEEHLERSINELVTREQHCDIMISDYIVESYKEKCIGYSPNHPTNDVLHIVAHRILSYIGIECNTLSSNIALDQYEMIIYPSVRSGLKLTFQKDLFVFNKKITPKPLSIPQYTRYYLYYTNPTLFYNELNDEDLSPTLNISNNMILLQNKIVMKKNGIIHINVSFKTNKRRKCVIHLSRKCCPTYTLSGTCVTKEKSYFYKLDSEGHIEIDVDATSWAIFDLMYLVIE
jgi:hypothetical protein